MIRHTLAITALATASLAALSIPAPAFAQGRVAETPAFGQRVCPTGYNAGSGDKSDKICYPRSKSSPAVFPKAKITDDCPAGYESDNRYWCAEKSGSGSSGSGSSSGAVYTPPTYASFRKANERDRCPVGYWTDSENDVNICATPYKDKAPASRLKKGACKADEIDEWGIYCTSRSTTMDRTEAVATAVADINRMFAYFGDGGNQEPDHENMPGIVAIWGPKASKSANSGASDSQAANSDGKSSTAQCDTSSDGSAKGAAVGGAVAGDAGAALGSVLGGLGKKKKKKAAGC